MKISHVLGILVLALSMLFAAGCGRSPSATVEKWISAIGSGDADEFNQYMVTKLAVTGEQLKKMPADVKEKIAALRVAEEKIDGDTASVTLQRNEGENVTIKLIRENGDWKINGVERK